jgi:peroxiredoxin (alkyl hydroperoxide reductase subunit C)
MMDRRRSVGALASLAIAVCLSAVTGCAYNRADSQPDYIPLDRCALGPGIPLVGSIAPGFVAPAAMPDGKVAPVRLLDYRGKYVLLFFYPADFSIVCPTEVVGFEDLLDDFHKLNCEVIGISVDSHYNHLAWRRVPRSEGGIGRIRYPLVSDITKDVARDYGVLVDEAVALRAWFLIDPKGKVRHALINDPAVGRNVGEALRTLAAVTLVDDFGEMCPENWHPGEKTLQPVPSSAPKKLADQGGPAGTD